MRIFFFIVTRMKRNARLTNLPNNIIGLIAGKLNEKSTLAMFNVLNKDQAELHILTMACVVLALERWGHWRSAGILLEGASLAQFVNELGLKQTRTREYEAVEGYKFAAFAPFDDDDDDKVSLVRRSGKVVATFKVERNQVRVTRVDATDEDMKTINKVVRSANERLPVRNANNYNNSNNNGSNSNSNSNNNNGNSNNNNNNGNQQRNNSNNNGYDSNAYRARHGPPIINWRRPTVPVQSPEQFVSNIMRMFPDSIHTQALHRALLDSTTRTANRRLADVAKSMHRLLKTTGGPNSTSATNIAKTTNLLKVWRSYQKWHATHGARAFAPGKRRKSVFDEARKVAFVATKIAQLAAKTANGQREPFQIANKLATRYRLSTRQVSASFAIEGEHFEALFVMGSTNNYYIRPRGSKQPYLEAQSLNDARTTWQLDHMSRGTIPRLFVNAVKAGIAAASRARVSSIAYKTRR